MSEDEFLQGVEIIAGLFYFVATKRPDSVRYSSVAQQHICYCIDDELLYEPFFADFGPLNLGKTYRFCQKTKQLLQEAEKHGRRVYLYAGPHAHQKANASVLVGIYQVIYLNRTADVAYKPLAAYKPYVPFRDASCGVSTFHLTVYDVLRGIQRARDVGFIDWNSGSSTWSLDEYEHYEQVENGDLNWIVPGKFVAFSGPAVRSNEVAGYRLHTPEDYWDYFRRKGVTTIVRLNKKVYDRKRFLDGGFKHHEMYFPDGSCPTDAIIQRFLDTVEAEPGCVAVHCKAGLGRTGVLICLYIMKHYRFTAEEVIGYIRVCRPGSVIGPQQNFLRELESRMWHEGELYRAARGLPKVVPAVSDLVISGRAAGAGGGSGAGAGAYGQDDGHGHVHGSQQQANGRNGFYGSYSAQQAVAVAASAAGAVVRSRASNGVGGAFRSGSAGMGAGVAGSGGGGGSGSILAGPAAASAAAASGAAASDMSLLQYSKMVQYGNAPGGYAQYLNNKGSAGGGGGAKEGLPAAPVASVSSFRSRYSSAAAGYNGGLGHGRSMTPMRYGQQAAAGGYSAGGHYGHHHHGHHHSHHGSGVSSSHPGPLASNPPPGSRGPYGSVSRSMPTGASGGGAGGIAAAGGVGRSPSTGRLSAAAGLAAPPVSSAGLRSTLHTDTLAAADRPKLIPERNTQSADIGAGFGLGPTSASGGGGGGPSWRISVPTASAGNSGANTPSGGGGGGMGRSSSGPTTPTTPGSTSGGVARILAPNGQPRKVPVALLNQYNQQAGGGGGGGGGGGVGGWAAGSGGSAAAALGPKPSAAGQLRAGGGGGYSYGGRQ